jgi:hypothetical protein
MGWTISVRSKGFERSRNAGVTPSQTSVTSNFRHTEAQWRVFSNAGTTTRVNAGSTPAWQTERVWQNVLSALVGFN